MYALANRPLEACEACRWAAKMGKRKGTVVSIRKTLNHNDTDVEATDQSQRVWNSHAATASTAVWLGTRTTTRLVLQCGAFGPV